MTVYLTPKKNDLKVIPITPVGGSALWGTEANEVSEVPVVRRQTGRNLLNL
jgi:hypothetical protein